MRRRSALLEWKRRRRLYTHGGAGGKGEVQPTIHAWVSRLTVCVVCVCGFVLQVACAGGSSS